MKVRLGAPAAITAAAHKLARLVYALLCHGNHYVDIGQEAFERQYRERMFKSLTRRAHQLGYALTPIAAT